MITVGRRVFSLFGILVILFNATFFRGLNQGEKVEKNGKFSS